MMEFVMLLKMIEQAAELCWTLALSDLFRTIGCKAVNALFVCLKPNVVMESGCVHKLAG